MPPKPPKQTPKSSQANKPGNAVAQKSKPKKILPISERLKRLFTSLCAQIDGGHFHNAIKTCDKILRLEPKDGDALQTKLFLLLQTEQYTAALTFLDADDNRNNHSFEKAYSLYRLQHEDEARGVLKTLQDDNGNYDHRGVIHLEAQLHYRDGSFQTAFELYNQLLDTAEPNSEEHSDILTNLQASQQHLDFITTTYAHALSDLPAKITNTIESIPPPTQASVVPIITTAERVRNTDDQPAQPIVKKVRKSRVPAGVIPGVTPPPDPERWLKKSERTTHGHSRKRKGAGGGGATQGSASLDAPSSGAPQGNKGGGNKGKRKK